MQMLAMVDYVREMTVKKSCKYGEYESFEHLLLLLFLLLLFLLFFLNIHLLEKVGREFFFLLQVSTILT